MVLSAYADDVVGTKTKLMMWDWIKPKMRGRVYILHNLVAPILWHRQACLDPSSGPSKDSSGEGGWVGPRPPGQSRHVYDYYFICKSVLCSQEYLPWIWIYNAFKVNFGGKKSFLESLLPLQSHDIKCVSLRDLT